MRGIGCALILLAGWILGVERLRPIKKRLEILEQLCCALERLYGEMSSRPTALGELFYGLAKECEEEAAAFFGLLSRRMDRLSTQSFAEIWQDCLHQSFAQMGKEERRELEKLGGILGHYDLPEQLAAMKPILSRLHGMLMGLREDFPVRRRLCLGVSCCLAAMLTLVLY